MAVTIPAARYTSSELRRPRERAIVATRVAARVLARPRREPGRLPRGPDRAPLGAPGARRRRRAARVPERVPAPRQRALRGHRARPDRDPLPVPSLVVRPRRDGCARSRPRREFGSLAIGDTDPASGPRARSTRGARSCSSTSRSTPNRWRSSSARFPADCAWARVDEFRCTAAVSIPAPCNWKTLIDGFSETYHVQGIHREMLPMCDDVNGPQRVWERHGKLQQSYGLASPRLRERPDDQQVWEAFVEVMGVRVGNSTQRDAGPAPDVRRAGRSAARSPQIVRERGVDSGHDWFIDARRRRSSSTCRSTTCSPT